MAARSDPRVMTTAAVVVARPRLRGRIARRRRELVLAFGTLAGAAAIGVTLGPVWLAATAAAVITITAARLSRPRTSS